MAVFKEDDKCIAPDGREVKLIERYPAFNWKEAKGGYPTVEGHYPDGQARWLVEHDDGNRTIVLEGQLQHKNDA